MEIQKEVDRKKQELKQILENGKNKKRMDRFIEELFIDKMEYEEQIN